MYNYSKSTKTEFLTFKFYKKFASFFAIAILASACNSIPSEIEVELPFQEIKAYDLEIVRKKLNANELNQAGALKTITSINFEVKELFDDSLVGVWKYGNTVLEGEGSEKLSADDEKVINIYRGLSIPLSVSKGGKIKLKDFSALKLQLEKLFLKIYGGDTLTQESEMYQRIKAMFHQQGSNEAMFLNSYFPEITTLFKEKNASYENESIVSTDSIQSPYSADYLKLHTMIDFSKTEDDLELFKTDSISEKDLELQLNQYMMSAFGEQAKNIPQNQVPRIKYRGETVIVLNDDEVLQSIENSKFINNSREEIVYSTKISLLK